MEDRLPSRKTGSYYGTQAPIFAPCQAGVRLQPIREPYLRKGDSFSNLKRRCSADVFLRLEHYSFHRKHKGEWAYYGRSRNFW